MAVRNSTRTQAAAATPKIVRPVVDEVDRRILTRLAADARIPNNALAEAVGIAPSTCLGRVRALRDSGVIRGYHADIDPRALGLSLGAIIRVRPAPGQLRNVAELAERTAEVVECHRITGDDCFLIRAHVRDVEHLEEVIDHFVVLGQTTTSIMQSSPVPMRGLAIEDGRLSPAA
jgi:Lrp/AsnC family leucine-responsive transcriptional regulator